MALQTIRETIKAANPEVDESVKRAGDALSRQAVAYLALNRTFQILVCDPDVRLRINMLRSPIVPQAVVDYLGRYDDSVRVRVCATNFNMSIPAAIEIAHTDPNQEVVNGALSRLKEHFNARAQKLLEKNEYLEFISLFPRLYIDDGDIVKMAIMFDLRLPNELANLLHAIDEIQKGIEGINSTDLKDAARAEDELSF